MSLIKNWILTADCHGGPNVIMRLSNIQRNMSEYKPEETGVIILGDAGINFWLNKTDKKYKKIINALGYTVYCVRGNHEERPENIKNMYFTIDDNVSNMVFMEDEFPNIKYLADGGSYLIGGYSCLVIGGAYSVDKWYRLKRAEAANESFSGWFKDEQLSKEEMDFISENVKGRHFDFVFSHTCPIDWEPSDLFLNNIDQSKVDKTMEIWMGQLKDTFDWGVWCFGHYHADRIEWPHVEQLYQEYETLGDIWNRWKNYDEAGKLDWWIPMSPSMDKINKGE